MVTDRPFVTVWPKSIPAALAVVLAVLACNLSQSPSSQKSVASTSTGIPFSASPIHLVIPAGLPVGATAETIDVVTDQTGAPWDVAPAHLQVTFQGYPLQNSFHVPQIFVYPSQPYADLNPAAAESLKRLNDVLANPSGQFSADTLPRVPFFNAGQVLAAQQSVIKFSGGAGVRFLTQYGQDVSPINNSGLFYHFEGLTSDGKYYLIAVLPTSLPFLAPDNNPDSPVPSGGIAFPSSSSSGSDFENYFKRVSDMIEHAPPDDFTPPLPLLDSLIQSISYP